MSAEAIYCEFTSESAPSTASSPFLSSTLRKPSQETVRPRFNRAATMPSANTCQHHMLAQTFHGVNYDNFHNTATAPTSPSASSTSGSLVSSSTDDPEYITYYSPAAPHRAPFSPKTKVAKKAKSDEENDPKISRPPNAWILYRSKKLAELKEANPKLYVSRSATRNKADRGLRPTQASISKQIASMWAAEPADVKDAYHQEASVRSMVHAIENPGYRFNPNKKRAEKEAKDAKVKVKRERSKSGSPNRLPKPLSIATAAPTPSANTTASFFSSPTFDQSPAMPQAQSSPWRLSEYQWALSPPIPQTSSMSSSQGSPSPFDARYAQERRPSLKAQWEAIFPNEKLDGSLSASSCSTSFSSDYAGAGSVSPLWGAGLLPSLSINEPPYTDAAPLPSALPGMLVGDATLNTKSPEVKTEISSPLQFAFAAPSMAQVTVPQYSFWPPALEGQVASNPAPSGLLAMSPGSPSLNVTPMAQSDQPTLFDIPQLVPAQQQPMTSLHTAARPLPVSQVEPSPVFSSLHSTQHVQPLADMPEWWPYRHMKVKPDENEGVPLEELLRSFEQRGSL